MYCCRDYNPFKRRKGFNSRERNVGKVDVTCVEHDKDQIRAGHSSKGKFERMAFAKEKQALMTFRYMLLGKMIYTR